VPDEEQLPESVFSIDKTISTRELDEGYLISFHNEEYGRIEEK
jgi:hypothetical protein